MTEPTWRRLLAELKRRRVPHVAGVYLIASWILLQVADVVVEPLALPPWTLTLLIVLAAFGFPLALLLAWALQRTPDGVRREVERAPTPVGFRRRLAVTSGVVAVALVGMAGWWTVGGPAEADLDVDLVAALPFRTAGASSELSYLREGLLDLLAARLAGTRGPQLVSPRRVIRALEQRAGSPAADLDPEEARSLARLHGAGRVLEGHVVGTAERFTVTATVYDVASGRRVSRAEAVGRTESIQGVVDRLANQLLAAEGGVEEGRLAAITTTSIEALRAYLEGQRAFRAGRYSAAVRAFDRAVELDSTFALAALGLLNVRYWTRQPSTNGARAERLARRGYEQLPETDRLFLDAHSPPEADSPGFNHRRKLRIIELAAERAPDLPELQYLLGDEYFHYGQPLGIGDWLERAKSGFDRALALEPQHIEALSHRWHAAQMEGDTARILELGRRLVELDPDQWAAEAGFLRIRLEQGPAAAADSFDLAALARGEGPALPTFGVNWEPNPEVIEAYVESLNHITEGGRRRIRAGTVLRNGIWRGRPSQVERALAVEELGIDPNVKRLELAMFWRADEEAAEEAAARVRAGLKSDPGGWRAEMGAPGYLEPHCALGLFDAFRGRQALADEAARRLIAAAEDYGDAALARGARLCADAVETLVLATTQSPEAGGRLATLDARVRDVPATAFGGPHAWLANAVVARLWEEAGELERALAAASRRSTIWGSWEYIVDSWRMEARLAARLGERERAITAARRHLGWREGAEPPFDARAAEIRRLLERLTAETAR